MYTSAVHWDRTSIRSKRNDRQHSATYHGDDCDSILLLLPTTYHVYYNGGSNSTTSTSNSGKLFCAACCSWNVRGLGDFGSRFQSGLGSVFGQSKREEGGGTGGGGGGSENCL